MHHTSRCLPIVGNAPIRHLERALADALQVR